MKLTLPGFILAVIAFGISTAAPVSAQSDINGAEFFAGFSHSRIDTGLTSEDAEEIGTAFGKRLGANGVNFSITGNVSKYVGLKFDLSTHSKTENIGFDGDVTVISGYVSDQPALQGLMEKIGMLGMTIISIRFSSGQY